MPAGDKAPTGDLRPGWNLAAFLVVLAAPSQLRLGRPFWALEPVEQVQAWVWGAAFLAFATAVRHLPLRGTGARRGKFLLAGTVAWASAWSFLAGPPGNRTALNCCCSRGGRKPGTRSRPTPRASLVMARE